MYPLSPCLVAVDRRQWVGTARSTVPTIGLFARQFNSRTTLW